MKIALELIFEQNSLNGENFINLFTQFIKFNPRSFTKKYATKAWDENKHIKIIASADKSDTLIVGGYDHDIFLTTDIISKKPYRIVQIIQDKDLFLPKDEEVEQNIERNGFIAAYLYNSDYVDVQSTASENMLGAKNYSTEILETIKNTPWKQGVHCREFDTRFNPGRRIMIPGTSMIAAWKMWFGKPFFEIVPKEKLLTFQYAPEVKELNSGKIFIKLFDAIEKSHTIESRFNQWKWQEWTDYDSLIVN